MVRLSARLPRDLEPNRLARARARLGPPLFDLTDANPTTCGIRYPDGLLEPLTGAAALTYRPSPRGPETTRRAVAREYLQWGTDVPPEHIVLTASTSEAYGFLLRLLTDPGDEILVPKPSYPLFEHLARLDGVGLAPYRLDLGSDWRIDFSSLDGISQRSRALVVVHPNNPTGSWVHPDDQVRLIELCRDRGLALIADEVFLPYPLHEGADSVASLAETSGCLTFSLGGLSKWIGLPQIKLAWIVVSGPEADRSTALDGLDYVADAYLSVATPVALAVPELLVRGDAIRSAIADRCRHNLRTLLEIASSNLAVTPLAPSAGWSAVVRVPAVEDDETLAIRLLRDRSVAVHPGYLFDLPGDGCLVVSLLPEPATFEEGMRGVVETVSELIAGAERAP